MRYKFLINLPIITIIILFVSCHKEKCHDLTNPKCDNYDPCYGKSSVESSFRIYENVGGVAIEADTVSSESPIIIWAKNKINCVLKWKITTRGYEMNSSDSMITIYPTDVFKKPNMPLGRTYTVTLQISKDNGSCGTLNRIDSISKELFIWPPEYLGNFTQINYLPIFGTYKGYKQSNPNEIVNVTIFDSVFTLPNQSCYGQDAQKKSNWNIIRNLAYNHFSSENFSYEGGASIYRKGASGFVLQGHNLVYYNQNGCNGSHFSLDYEGYGWLDYNDSRKLYIKYTYWDTVTFKPINDYYTGVRIN